MFLILPIIVTVGALLVVLFIVSRHYRQLTLLEVADLPEEKMAAKKDEFLRERAKKEAKARQVTLGSWWRSLWRPLKIFQLSFRNLVGRVERRLFELGHHKTSRTPHTPEQEQALRMLIQDGLNAIAAHDWENAEKKLIAAIALDERNVTAYRALADVYFEQEQFEEAKQTYRFVLYLDSQDEAALLRLAEIAEHEGKLEAAVEYYQQAVLLNDHVATRFAKIADLLNQLGQPATALEAIQQAVMLESQNPKYLDSFIETSILAGDKNLADEGYQQLRMVNPDNQKLATFRERIDKLSSPV